MTGAWKRCSVVCFAFATLGPCRRRGLPDPCAARCRLADRDRLNGALGDKSRLWQMNDVSRGRRSGLLDASKLSEEHPELEVFELDGGICMPDRLLMCCVNYVPMGGCCAWQRAAAGRFEKPGTVFWRQAQALQSLFTFTHTDSSTSRAYKRRAHMLVTSWRVFTKPAARCAIRCHSALRLPLLLIGQPCNSHARV